MKQSLSAAWCPTMAMARRSLSIVEPGDRTPRLCVFEGGLMTSTKRRIGTGASGLLTYFTSGRRCFGQVETGQGRNTQQTVTVTATVMSESRCKARMIDQQQRYLST